MRIWAISDGKPGHYNQTKAIVNAFSGIEPVIMEWLEVKMRLGGFRFLLKILLNHFSAPLPLWLLRFFYKLPTLPGQNPDCIVSTGGKTLYLNAWLGRNFCCKNFFSGTLRGLKPEQFTAFFTLVPFPGAGNNIVLEHAPTLIDPVKVAQAGQKFKTERGLDEDRLCALFIGGDRFGYQYCGSDWDNLVAGMVRHAEIQGVRWLLTTSRRTGLGVEQMLKKQLPADILADAVWWNERPRPCIQEFLGAADVIFVTEDSMAMIADGIASEKPVCSLSPSYPAPEQSYQHALDGLLERQRIFRLPLDEFSKTVRNKDLLCFKKTKKSVEKKIVEELSKYYR